MKKILLFGGALALLSPYDASYGNNPDSGVKGKGGSSPCGTQADFAGFSIGFGALGSRHMGDARIINDRYHRENITVNTLGAAAPTNRDIAGQLGDAGFDVDISSVRTTGAAGAPIPLFGASWDIRSVDGSHESNRPLGKTSGTSGGGWISAGFVHFYNESNYMGLNFTVDLDGKKTGNMNRTGRSDFGETRTRCGGIRPIFVAELGTYIRKIKSLIGVGLGCTYTSIECSTNTGKVKSSGMAPVIRVSLRTAVRPNLSVMLACDYSFPYSAEKTLTRDVVVPLGVLPPAMAGTPTTLTQSSKAKLSTKTLTVRLGLLYNIKGGH